MTLVKHSHLAIQRYMTDMHISAEMLAKKSGISLNKINKVLLYDDELLTYKQLAKIAELLFVPIVYLTTNDVIFERTQPKNIEYRNSTDNQNPYLEQSLIAQFCDVRQNYLDVLDLLEQQAQSFDLKLTGDNAQLDAQRIIQYFDIKQQPKKIKSNDDYYNAWREIIELKDVIILEQDRVKVGADGMCLYFPQVPIITIFSTNQAPTRKLFTLIHELVHLGLGESVFDGHILESNHQLERYCNQVAGFVLAPQDVIEAVYHDDLTLDENINTIRRSVKASKVAIAIQLKQLGYISQHQLSDYIEQQAPKNQGFFAQASKENKVLKHFGFNFVEKIMSAMWQEQITSNTAKQILHIHDQNAFNQLQDKVF